MIFEERSIRCSIKLEKNSLEFRNKYVHSRNRAQATCITIARYTTAQPSNACFFAGWNETSFIVLSVSVNFLAVM